MSGVRDTIADAIFAGHETFKAADQSGKPLRMSRVQADAVVTAVRNMTLEEVAELRPDLAAELAVARETAAARGAYIIATARARAADGRNVNVRVVVEDVSA